MFAMWTALSLSPLVLLALVAWSDLATRTIPNWLCAALALIGLGIQTAAGPVALAESAAISAVLFLALVAVHARGALGGGDVKLAAAIAFVLPASRITHFLSVTALAGGILVLFHLSLRHLPAIALAPSRASGLRRILAIEHWRIRRHGSLPYGIALACGGAWELLSPFWS